MNLIYKICRSNDKLTNYEYNCIYGNIFRINRLNNNEFHSYICYYQLKFDEIWINLHNQYSYSLPFHCIFSKKNDMLNLDKSIYISYLNIFDYFQHYSIYQCIRISHPLIEFDNQYLNHMWHNFFLKHRYMLYRCKSNLIIYYKMIYFSTMDYWFHQSNKKYHKSIDQNPISYDDLLNHNLNIYFKQCQYKSYKSNDILNIDKIWFYFNKFVLNPFSSIH